MKFYQLTVIVLLSCICVLLAAILIRIPDYKPIPTLGDLRAAKSKEQKEALMLKKPIIHIPGTMGVYIEGQQNPIEVEIENQPIQVQAN